jgi:hypothetical protein
MRILLLIALVGCKTTETTTPAPTETVEHPAEPAPVAAPAMAEGEESIALFGGRSGTAVRHHAPAEGSIEHAILDSLTLLSAENYDGWMDTYCHADACDDQRKRDAMSSHVLPSAKAAASTCVHDGDLLVTKTEEENGFTKVWIYCGEGRMPAPATAQNVDGAWKFSSVSW